MRADFYAKCAAFAELAQLMAAHQHLVSPARARGLARGHRGAGVAQRLGAPVGSGRDHPGRRGRPSGEPAVAPGSARRAVGAAPRQRLDAGRLHRGRARRRRRRQAGRRGLRGLGPDEQAAARDVLLRLIQLGDGTEDTRRQAREDELLAVSGDEATVRLVIERFVEARLLTTSTGAERCGDRRRRPRGADHGMAPVARRGWTRTARTSGSASA